MKFSKNWPLSWFFLVVAMSVAIYLSCALPVKFLSVERPCVLVWIVPAWRLGVAKAFLQTLLLLIMGVSHPFPPDLQNIIHPKQLELGSWNFEKMFNPHQVSHIRCQVSGVRCQVTGVTCHVSNVTCHVSQFFWGGDKVFGLMGVGSIINEAYSV